MARLIICLMLVVFVVGCVNPTHTYHPSKMPDRSKGELIEYDGAEILTWPTRIAYEAETDDSVTLFVADKFCYDARNDYIVFPRSGVEYSEREELYLAVPIDSVVLCKNGVIKDNSYFVRNEMLYNVTLGALAFGGFFTIGAGTLVFLIKDTGSLLGFIGLGATIGGLFGALVSNATVHEIEDVCEDYYTEEEMREFLYNNSCY